MKTKAQIVTKAHRGVQAEAARQLGVTKSYVTMVLKPDTCASFRHSRVVAIRSALEQRLAARGWTGDAAALWAEYDEPFKVAA